MQGPGRVQGNQDRVRESLVRGLGLGLESPEHNRLPPNHSSQLNPEIQDSDCRYPDFDKLLYSPKHYPYRCNPDQNNRGQGQDRGQDRDQSSERNS